MTSGLKNNKIKKIKARQEINKEVQASNRCRIKRVQYKIKTGLKRINLLLK